MKKVLKLVFKLVLALALVAVGALTVLFEIFPKCTATAKVAPYCEGPYLTVKAQVVWLYELVEARLSKDNVERTGVSSKPEAPAEPATVAPSEPEPEKPAAEGLGQPVPLAKAKWYSRTRVSESACRGKVVVVCVWNEESPEGLELLAQAQRIADGFGGKKDLVVFAVHRGGSGTEAQKALKRARVTIPVCESSGLSCATRIAGTPPYFYLVDKKGALKYVGRSDKAVLTKMSELF